MRSVRSKKNKDGCKFVYVVRTLVCLAVAVPRTWSWLQPKGKKNTLGQKDIHRNNLETLKFYLLFSIVGTVSPMTSVPMPPIRSA